MRATIFDSINDREVHLCHGKRAHLEVYLTQGRGAETRVIKACDGSCEGETEHFPSEVELPAGCEAPLRRFLEEGIGLDIFNDPLPEKVEKYLDWKDQQFCENLDDKEEA